MSVPKVGIIMRMGVGLLGLMMWGNLSGRAFAAPTPVPNSAQVFTAEVFVGGTIPPTQILISHSPLRGISPVSRVMIVQGVAGTNPDDSIVPFPDRITPMAQHQAVADGILVRLLYRVIPNETVDPATVPFEEMSIDSSADPLPFAFQIPPDKISVGIVEYKIFAHRLHAGATNQSETAAHPSEALFNPQATVSVGIQAGASQMFDATGGRVEVFQGNPNVSNTYLDIPAGFLPSGSNIALTQLPLDSPLIPPLGNLVSPLSMYRLDFNRRFNSSVLINVLYPDFEFPIGKDGVLDGTQYPVSSAGLVFWDGYTWRRLGGRVNTNTNSIIARIGNFQYVAVVPMGAAAPQDARPMDKIITPNGDGFHDKAEFVFGSPSESVTVDIFDVTNHRVRTLRGMGSLEWDGRDDSGKIVESGIYIYQYKLEGTRVSGVIAVAK